MDATITRRRVSSRLTPLLPSPGTRPQFRTVVVQFRSNRLVNPCRADLESLGCFVNREALFPNHSQNLLLIVVLTEGEVAFEARRSPFAPCVLVTAEPITRCRSVSDGTHKAFLICVAVRHNYRQLTKAADLDETSYLCTCDRWARGTPSVGPFLYPRTSNGPLHRFLWASE